MQHNSLVRSKVLALCPENKGRDETPSKRVSHYWHSYASRAMSVSGGITPLPIRLILSHLTLCTSCFSYEWYLHSLHISCPRKSFNILSKHSFSLVFEILSDGHTHTILKVSILFSAPKLEPVSRVVHCTQLEHTSRFCDLYFSIVKRVTSFQMCLSVSFSLPHASNFKTVCVYILHNKLPSFFVIMFAMSLVW